MKKELDEETVIRQALSVCKGYLRPDAPGGNLQGCLKMELEEVKSCYRASIGKSRYSTLTAQELSEMDQVLSHFEPILLEKTTAIRDRMLRDNTVRRIRFASAEAVIRSSLEAAGLKAQVFPQQYRAAVDVPLQGSTCVRFHVSYKNALTPGYMDGIVGAVLDMKSALTRLGLSARIKRI